MDELVSCVLATGNRNRFFPQALRCFASQTYCHRELIVVDDGEQPVRNLCRGVAGVKYVRLDRRASTGAKLPLKAKAPPLPPVKLTWGGFLAAESVYRQHNTVSDMGTPFTSIPYPFSPQYSEHEFHGSARASRLSLLAEGTIDPAQKLAGYYEMDFLGTGVTSNYNQSNSWDLRLRQAHLTYDNSNTGFHLMAGQGWSMATQNTVGIIPRKENVPITIEANYLAGFDYTRNWQLRFVQDFGQVFWVGLSLENPAEQVFNGSAATGAIGNGELGFAIESNNRHCRVGRGIDHRDSVRIAVHDEDPLASRVIDHPIGVGICRHFLQHL